MPQVLLFHGSDRNPFLQAGDALLADPSLLADAIEDAKKCSLDIRSIQLTEDLRAEAKGFPGDFTLVVCLRESQDYSCPSPDTIYELLSILAGRKSLRLEDSTQGTDAASLAPSGNLSRALATLRSKLQLAEPLIARLLVSQALRAGPSMGMVDAVLPVSKTRPDLVRALSDLCSSSAARHAAIISGGRYVGASRNFLTLDPMELLCLAEMGTYLARNPSSNGTPARLISDPTVADGVLWAVRLQDVLTGGALDVTGSEMEDEGPLLIMLFPSPPNSGLLRNMVQANLRDHSSTYGLVAKAALDRSRPEVWSDTAAVDTLQELPGCAILCLRPFLMECDIKRSPLIQPKKGAEPFPAPMTPEQVAEARKVLRRVAQRVDAVTSTSTDPTTPGTEEQISVWETQSSLETLVRVDNLLVGRVVAPARTDLMVMGAFKADAQPTECLNTLRKLVALSAGVLSFTAMI